MNVAIYPIFLYPIFVGVNAVGGLEILPAPSVQFFALDAAHSARVVSFESCVLSHDFVRKDHLINARRAAKLRETLGDKEVIIGRCYGPRTIRWSFITLVIGSALDATVPSNTSKPIAPRRLLFALLRINILLGTSSVLLDVFQNTVLARLLGGDEISIRESHIRSQN